MIFSRSFGYKIILILLLHIEFCAFAENTSDPITILITKNNSLDESLVEFENITSDSSASHNSIIQGTIESRPLLRPGEMLETVPGMVVTQHSGDGKANQYFLRGFNLDHGTDFATYVNDMPVNMRTHAHGQGYTDLNFIIPELVKNINYKKGVYYAEEGDFSSAGTARFTLNSSLEKGISKLTIGEYDFKRGLLAKSFHTGKSEFLVAGEVFFYDGPWDRPNNLEKFNGMLSYTYDAGLTKFMVLGLAYDNTWNSTDQIPQRAISENIIDRYGNLDSTLGGNSSRYSLSATAIHSTESSISKASLYGISYDLDLFSNFTYYLDNPVNGDQFEQYDKRKILGFNLDHVEKLNFLSFDQKISLGLQERSDFIQRNGLYNTQNRNRLSTVRSDSVREHSLGTYLKNEITVFDSFKVIPGIRQDIYAFDIDSHQSINSGDKIADVYSPKLNFVVGPWKKNEIFINSGYGFHSNDARGVTTRVDPKSGEVVDPLTPLVKTKGAEIGVRSKMIENFTHSIAFWMLQSDSELVFVGDAGTNEPSYESVRKGIEYLADLKLVDLVKIDFSYALSNARFRNTEVANENRIPGAIEQVLSSGISYDSSGFSPEGNAFFSTIRFRQFAPYALTEDNTVRSTTSTLFNGRVGYRFEDIWCSLDILNIFNSRDNDIQYYYTSRLQTEASEGINDIHVHPFEPQSVRFSVGASF